MFLKAIQEIPIDKLNIIKVEEENFKYSAYKIFIDTEIGNIEYRYLEQKDIYTSMSGLHCIFFSENYSLEDVMTKSEKEEILNFMLIMEKYLCYKEDLQRFNDKSQKFVEKAKQIEGNNGNNN